MTISIELSEDQLLRLDERARLAGKSAAAYLSGLVDWDLSIGPSLEEILAPFRQQVAESGLGDAELDDLFEDARSDVAANRLKHLP